MLFHVKLPIFVARQWIRHRTANVNEISGRYSQLASEFFIPEPDAIRKQSAKNRQSRNEQRFEPKITQLIIGLFRREQHQSYKNYKKMLDVNLARELARINLPLSVYTEWYWKIDLHNLLHFLKLRMDSHAQKEIRDYANVMATLVKKVVPIAYEAWEEHILNAENFSQTELKVLKKLAKGENIPLTMAGRKSAFEKLGQ